MLIKATEDQYFRVSGRNLVWEGIRYLNWSGSFVEFEFTGNKVSAVLRSVGFADAEILHTWVGVYLDGSDEAYRRIKLDPDETREYALFESEESEHHIFRLVKMSEAAFAKLGLVSFEVECTADGAPVPTKPLERRIEFIGDSITCGYGNEGVLNVDVFTTAQENPMKAYSIQTARRLGAEYQLTSWSGIGVISAWVDENTNEPLNDWLMPKIYPYTDAAWNNDCGLKQEDWEKWDTRRFQPDVIVLNLGTNDRSYTRYMEDRTREFERLYIGFLDTVRAMNPDSEIVCCLGVMERELCPVEERIVKQYALDHHDSHISYLDLAGQDPADGIGADSHPSQVTHQKMADAVAAYIRTRVPEWN